MIETWPITNVVYICIYLHIYSHSHIYACVCIHIHRIIILQIEFNKILRKQ